MFHANEEQDTLQMMNEGSQLQIIVFLFHIHANAASGANWNTALDNFTQWTVQYSDNVMLHSRLNTHI